jgi:hypothetical protein
MNAVQRIIKAILGDAYLYFYQKNRKPRSLKEIRSEQGKGLNSKNIFEEKEERCKK